MKKDIKKIVDAACKRGWRLAHGGKHQKLLRDGCAKITVPISPSCSHAPENLRKQIEKAEKDAGL